LIRRIFRFHQCRPLENAPVQIADFNRVFMSSRHIKGASTYETARSFSELPPSYDVRTRLADLKIGVGQSSQIKDLLRTRRSMKDWLKVMQRAGCFD
jgi:hypothetical protein